MLLWCLFGVSGIVPKVLKMLVFFFPSFWGFGGVGYFCLFGFRRFRCFGVLVFLFFFFRVGFVSVLFLFCLLLFLFSCWIVFGVGSCFVFVFLFFFVCFRFLFVFVFWEGFKGQVRWPKGPPHLALNPPYFICFVFCFCLFV